MSGIEIRRAQLIDAAPLAALTGELGYPTETALMQARLQALLPLREHCIAVAVRAQQVLGWVHIARQCALQSGEFAEIVGLVVGAAARRLGVGAALVREAERWAHEAGLASLTVRSNLRRTEAHQFYPAQGFALAKSQHVYRKSVPEQG